jgi:ribosomal protein S27AE
MLWRCENENCEGGDFEGESHECPKCHGFLVQELLPVHYLVPAADGPIKTGLGGRMVACDPNRSTLPQSTGVRKSVTCPACRRSVIFAEDEADKIDNHVKYIERVSAQKQGIA